MVAAPMPTQSLRVSLAIDAPWGLDPLLRCQVSKTILYRQELGLGLRRMHMILAIADILSAAEYVAVRAGLASATFVDGKTTAGWSAGW